MGETRREGERKRTLAVGADEPEQHRASRPPLLPKDRIWSRNASAAPFLRGQRLESGGLLYVEAAAIEPAPGDAKPLAESRPYLVTARNDLESLSRRVPFRPVLSQHIPQAPATYVQHDEGRRL